MPALVAGIALVLGIGWFGLRADNCGVERAVAGDTAATPETPVSTKSGTAASTDSLRGTEVDGKITLDATGRPIADRGMRRLFDYFLARIGERSLTDIRASLTVHLSATFPTPIVGEVLDRYDAYVALLQAMAALSPTGDDLADAERLHALRRERLGQTVADAWFGEEERYLQATLARRAVLADASLDAAAKAKALAALDASLDPAQRAARAPTDTAAAAMAQTDLFDANGVSAAERFAAREHDYGRDAATRMAALDHERAAWETRLGDYAVQRQRVLADRSLSDAARAQALQNLLVSRFDARERLRVDGMTRGGLLR
jgi:lipase chaperone LimK